MLDWLIAIIQIQLENTQKVSHNYIRTLGKFEKCTFLSIFDSIFAKFGFLRKNKRKFKTFDCQNLIVTLSLKQQIKYLLLKMDKKALEFYLPKFQFIDDFFSKIIESIDNRLYIYFICTRPPLAARALGIGVSGQNPTTVKIPQ